ncbi:hypothetical protein L6Q21_11295 [Sandaracinobacter sp. RS1-74]|uniref:hypothetical protein n=1 Tax=Sandaracinobacteroides sayramensis TaxID=2913411 RepID=UPI001EDB2B8E|nr:hypothetical protein [Sandaracinobacteroides sayramensis]MCG2841566.1 hypothetical protein [Sandaracinobacteroides sayramensis]
MDIRRDDLDAAVDAGVLDARSRDRLLAFLAARAEGAAGPDNESFRLLTGFNDIFVSLACILLLLAAGSLLPGALGPVGVAALSWALAEYFTRRRRMALPSILLLLSFVGAVFATILQLLGGGGHWGTALAQARLTGHTTAFFAPFLVSGLVAAGAAALHWRRFRVPITLAAGAATSAVGLIALTGALSGGENALLAAALLSGFLIFAAAMWFDMQDRARLTRSTDIAFWLHLLAAPLIVHPIFAYAGVMRLDSGPLAAAIVLAVYALLTLVALAIDRRALLVSALIYVLYSLQGLFSAGEVAAAFGLTALLIGSFLVMLSAAWGALRARLLRALPPAWSARLPEPA